MLRVLLFILVIVILIAITLNFDFFSSPTLIKPSSSNLIKKVQVIHKVQHPTIAIEEKPIDSPESNLSKELQLLLNQAQLRYRKGKYEEAIVLYDKVIKKSKDSKEIKILKLFARACLNRANSYYSYPKYDVDSAIESFELIIDKFQNKYNKELLLKYMEARLNKASLISKEELIETYTVLIEKFQNDKEHRFEKEVEELLYAKSFALMGIDDEEAIAVLDSLIGKYKDANKSNIPDTVKYSILNNIELSIITANETDKYVDLANKYMSDLPDTKPIIDMLSIIKNSQDLDQNEAVEEWIKEHKNYNFPDWDFSELRKWVNKMEVPQRQARVRQYLDMFERKKYATNNSREGASVPLKNQVPQKVNEEEEEEEEHEEDPYINDILETLPEITYPDPYAQDSQSDGATQTYRGD